MKYFGRFLRFLFSSRLPAAILSCCIGLLSALFAAGLYGVSSFILSLAALHPTFDLITVPAVLVRFLGLGRAVLAYAERYVSHNETFKVLSRLRVYVFDSLEPFALGNAPPAARGIALSTIISGVETVQDAILRVVYPIAVALLTAAAGTATAWLWSPLLALVFFLLAVPLAFLLFGLAMLESRRRQSDTLKATAALYQTTLDVRAGLADIASNQAENLVRQRFQQQLESGAQIKRGLSFAAALGDAAASLYTGICTAVLLAVCVYLCAAGRLSGVMLAAVFIALTYLSDAVSGLSAVSARADKAARAVSDVFADRPDNKSFERTYVPAPVSPSRLSADDLSFSYPNRTLFSHLSFMLEPGLPTLLVGPSGCGKSTIADLLTGFRRAKAGRIFADGVDLDVVHPAERLHLFSVLEQSPHFFHDTLRANLLADGSVPGSTLMETLTAVGLGDFIASLPDGLDTILFESGANLSGGELQRLGLARTLLRDAPFYIFDEPTASLDTCNEKKVIELILALSRVKGVLLITHRHTDVIPARQIIRIDAPGK